MSNLSRRQFLWGSAMAGAAPALAQRSQESVAPNVVLIIAEELSAWMCGCYGNREIKTPNIDLLARLGTRCQDAFAVTPAGSPGRATLLTGRTPMQHGIEDFITSDVVAGPPQGQAQAPASFAKEVMLSDILSGRGYNCAYAGLWDMGDHRQPGHGLTGTYTAGADVSYRNPRISRNGTEQAEEGYLTDLITKSGVEYIGRQKPGEPFCLTLSYPNPREPYDAHPERYYEMYAGARFETIGWLPKAANALRGGEYLEDTVGSIRKFAAGVTALDAQLPLLQKALREKKIWSDTIVVFTSASGNCLGRHGLWGGGLASDPINMYDDAMRVPLIASWPGEIPIEGNRPELVSAYDVLPTICEACGAPPLAERGLCGRSFLTQLLGNAIPKGEPAWPEVVFGQYRNTQMARDNRYKVVLRDGGEGPNDFYSFSRDPRELRNEYENMNFVTVRDRLAGLIGPWADQFS